MPGMSRGLPPGNPLVVSAFESTLIRQSLLVAGIFLLLLAIWGALVISLRRPSATHLATGAIVGAAGAGAAGTAHDRAETEPAARRFLRIAFASLWIFDSLLGLQTSVPLYMPSRVFEPAASAPLWVHQVASFAVVVWSYHPIVVSCASVWVGLGIGAWLLLAARGPWSRCAGAASVVWGLTAWVFGESFGGLLAPGASWMFGAPGAALFYCVAGALLTLGDKGWEEGQVGLAITRTAGIFFLLMALLQAWPGRGFWRGDGISQGASGTLVSMLTAMARTPQPHFLSSWITSFASLVGAHGLAVNLAVVVVLSFLGLAYLSERKATLRLAVGASVLVCLADWVLVQDLGFLGGTGTDPNSMIPTLVILVTAYMAITRAGTEVELLSPELELPARLEPDLPQSSVSADIAPGPTWRSRARDHPGYVLRGLCSFGALAVTALGVVPIVGAAVNSHADPIVYQAIDGPPTPIDVAVPNFVLRDQSGGIERLVGLRGKVVVLAFLDPVGVASSRALGHELAQADGLLAAERARVEFVAVDTSPANRSPASLRAFDRAQGLAATENWLFLTGPENRLAALWKAYGIPAGAVQPRSGGVASDAIYVLDTRGTERYRLNVVREPSTEATRASFTGVLAATVQRVMASP
jgi:cytochrome oxidase Cu insertion factor (SCO1/SenC/PrrC family)